MEVKNPGLAFNKWVFHRLNASNRDNFKKDTKTLHERLLQLPLNQTAAKQLDLSAHFKGNTRFFSLELAVAWPGLMMGLGYGHGAKTEADNKSHPLETEMKNGFYFDFTTGIPVLPGSSVKGILRSFFPERLTKGTAINKAVEKRIIEILNEVVPVNGGWDTAKVQALEDIIFEGKTGKDKDRDTIYLPSTKQDTFLDAFPSEGIEADIFIENPPKPVKVNGISQKLFLGEDVITPHRHPLKDPVPLKHLKILPGVKMKFQFLLNDLGLPASDKEKLFRYLLCLGGVGAKSGVGFGQLTDSETPQSHNPFSGNGYIDFDDLDTSGWEDEIEEEYDINRGRSTPPPGVIAQPTIQEDSSWPEINTLKSGSEVTGTVIQSANGSMTIQLHIKGTKQLVNVPGKEPVKSVLKLRVSETSGKPEKGNYKIEKAKKVI